MSFNLSIEGYYHRKYETPDRGWHTWWQVVHDVEHAKISARRLKDLWAEDLEFSARVVDLDTKEILYVV